MQLGRKMRHEIGEGTVNLRFGDQVIVVEDQEKLPGPARQRIDERLQDIPQWRRRHRLRLQIGQERSTETWLYSIQRRKCIGPEEHWLIITLVQGNPGHMWRFRVLPYYFYERKYISLEKCL